MVHYFCPTCGIEMFEIIEDQTIGVNVRTVDGIELSKLKLRYEDGRNDL